MKLARHLVNGPHRARMSTDHRSNPGDAERVTLNWLHLMDFYAVDAFYEDFPVPNAHLDREPLACPKGWVCAVAEALGYPMPEDVTLHLPMERSRNGRREGLTLLTNAGRLPVVVLALLLDLGREERREEVLALETTWRIEGARTLNHVLEPLLNRFLDLDNDAHQAEGSPMQVMGRTEWMERVSW